MSDDDVYALHTVGLALYKAEKELGHYEDIDIDGMSLVDVLDQCRGIVAGVFQDNDGRRRLKENMNQ